MSTRRWMAAMMLSGVVLPVPVTPATAQDVPREITVVIENLRFKPDEIRIKGVLTETRWKIGPPNLRHHGEPDRELVVTRPRGAAGSENRLYGAHALLRR